MPVKIYKARSKFERSIADEKAFVESLINLRRKSSGRYYSVPKKRKEKLCESSFLVLFTAWEDFLESTFENYLVLGAQCVPPIKIKAHFDNQTLAHEIICGERNYVDWVMANDVKKRALIYFKDGEPFKTALDLSKKDLEKMRILRNEIAHQSAHSKKKFNSMVREIYGSGRANNAGGFLLSVPPSSFNLPGSTKVFSSIFEYFADILLATSSLIVPDSL